MSFKQVLSQPHAVRHFQSVLARGRLAHAYVFCGPDGVGKALFARELVKTLLCSGRSDKETSPDACDQCESCKAVDSGDNPDLFWITLDYKVIKIEAIRELERLAVLKPHGARRRVFVIEDAERMNAEAANCLLKTLEEPPRGVVILLTATSLARLPRTIVSRCQVVRFQPIEPATLKKLIKKNLDVFKEGDSDGDSYKEALEWLAGASCGSMGWAARLVKEEAVTRRKKLFDRLSSLHMDDNFLVSQEVLDWCPYNKDEGLEGRRARLRIWMCLMLEFYRDVLLCKVGADELGLFNMDYRDKIAARARQLSERTVEEIMGEINSSLDGLRRNANINLLVENMFTRIARLEANTYGAS